MWAYHHAFPQTGKEKASWKIILVRVISCFAQAAGFGAFSGQICRREKCSVAKICWCKCQACWWLERRRMYCCFHLCDCVHSFSLVGNVVTTDSGCRFRWRPLLIPCGFPADSSRFMFQDFNNKTWVFVLWKSGPRRELLWWQLTTWRPSEIRNWDVDVMCQWPSLARQMSIWTCFFRNNFSFLGAAPNHKKSLDRFCWKILLYSKLWLRRKRKIKLTNLSHCASKENEEEIFFHLHWWQRTSVPKHVHLEIDAFWWQENWQKENPWRYIARPVHLRVF